MVVSLRRALVPKPLISVLRYSYLLAYVVDPAALPDQSPTLIATMPFLAD